MAEVSLGEVTGQILVDAARAAAANAYAPYSGFAVGAALLLADGATVTGANMENASYGLSLCAEAVALGTASSSGRLRDVVALAVAGGRIEHGRLAGAEPVAPCGRCRQLLAEAAALGRRDLPVYCTSGDGTRTERHLLSALLPHAFGPGSLPG